MCWLRDTTSGLPGVTSIFYVFIFKLFTVCFSKKKNTKKTEFGCRQARHALTRACAITRAHRYTDAQMHRCTDTPTCTHTQTHTQADTWKVSSQMWCLDVGIDWSMFWSGPDDHPHFEAFYVLMIDEVALPTRCLFGHPSDVQNQSLSVLGFAASLYGSSVGTTKSSARRFAKLSTGAVRTTVSGHPLQTNWVKSQFFMTISGTCRLFVGRFPVSWGWSGSSCCCFRSLFRLKRTHLLKG